MRKQWFEYVSKVRRKEARKTKKDCSHREAMKLAASTWPAEKVKLQNKAKREARKAAKAKLATRPPTETPAVPEKSPQ